MLEAPAGWLRCPEWGDLKCVQPWTRCKCLQLGDARSVACPSMQRTWLQNPVGRADQAHVAGNPSRTV